MRKMCALFSASAGTYFVLHFPLSASFSLCAFRFLRGGCRADERRIGEAVLRVRAEMDIWKGEMACLSAEQ